jgi:hypothetical protein
VPYLSAHIVADLLDEWVGPANWRDTYELTELAGGPALWCHVEVHDPVGRQWVRKSDIGVAPAPGPEEGMREKGMVSDAFKRTACLKWGAGRNVYELPVLWAPVHVRDDSGGQPRPIADVEQHLVSQLRARGYLIDRAATEDQGATEGSLLADTASAADELAPAAAAAPALAALACPACGSPVSDQRGAHDRDPAKPAWTCSNRLCVGGGARKDGRGHWRWSSWDPQEFAGADEMMRPTREAKRRVLEAAAPVAAAKGGRLEDYARAAWTDAASDQGESPDVALAPHILALVEARALELLAELATVERSG